MDFSPNNITYIAKTNFRNQNKTFGIKPDDRLLHTYIVGKTGTGKTTLLKNMFIQDIESGNGCCFVDPHGDVVSEIYSIYKDDPRHEQHLIYINCTDPSSKVGFNPLKQVPYSKRVLVASGLLEIFKKLFDKKS